MKYFGGIEAGGTKFVCAVSDENMNILERVSFSTRDPESTLQETFEFFDKYDLSAIGLGSFGPVDIVEKSKTYGYVLSTPKLPWRNFDFLGAVKAYKNHPVFLTTDVNAAAYAEYIMGASQNKDNSVYVTVGTGVGVGIIIDGKIFEGAGHPEFGHMMVNQLPEDKFEGNCFYHKNCLEGLATGPAIMKRTGKKAQQLSADDPAWEFESAYLAQMCMNITLAFRPEIIVLGGGVMKQDHLVGRVRVDFEEYIAGYVDYPAVNEYIKTPGLGDNAGILGTLLLAKKKDEESIL